jgi:hypothetical protein
MHIERCGTCGHVGIGAAYNHDCYWVFRERMTKKNPAAVALGTLGGASKSTRKIQASRENGKKGGRPKKEQEMAETYVEGYRHREDAVMRHKKTGKLYRILKRYDQIGADLSRPRAACQLVLSVNPRAYSLDGRSDRTLFLENLEPHSDDK